MLASVTTNLASVEVVHYLVHFEWYTSFSRASACALIILNVWCRRMGFGTLLVFYVSVWLADAFLWDLLGVFMKRKEMHDATKAFCWTVWKMYFNSDSRFHFMFLLVLFHSRDSRLLFFKACVNGSAERAQYLTYAALLFLFKKLILISRAGTHFC